jgi:ABC-type multidrug transport system fused ATPase/permease subunit
MKMIFFNINKFTKIVTKKELKNSLTLLINFIIVSILESLTLLLISKIVYILQSPKLSDNDLLFKSYIIVKDSIKLNINILTYTSSLFLILFILKTILYIYLSKKQSQFIFYTQANLSKRLFIKYFEINYLNYKKNSSSIIIRNLTTEVSQFVQLLQSSIIAINEFLIILSLVIVLLFEDLESTLILSTLILIPTILFRQLTKDKILQWGKNRQYSEGKKIQAIQEAHGLFKEIMIYGKTQKVFENFTKIVDISAESGLKQNFNQQIPKYFLELFSIVSLFLIGFIMYVRGNDISKIFSVISLMIASSFKLIPSVNRLIGAIQNYKYCLPTIENLYNILIINSENKSNLEFIKKINFEKNIYINNIEFSYEKNIQKLFFNFNINKGDKIGIVGESGSGKSTLIDILLGLIEPNSGVFSIDNNHYKLYRNQEWYKKIGYVPQDIYLTNDSIKNNIALYQEVENLDVIKLSNCIKLVKIEKFTNSLKNGVETIISENGSNLSGGQKQRIGIARALYMNPEILILDEATSALNEELETEILNDILKLNDNLTILMITHRKNSLINCNKIFEIKNNSILKIK